MLLVKASARPSQIDGIGLFADEKIPKGATIWKYDPRFDISFSKEEMGKLPLPQKDFIIRYAYFSENLNKYVLPIDDSRFTNHSATNPNEDIVSFPGEIETRGIANCDIPAGEEILVNYRLFDKNDADSLTEYLNS